MSQTTALILGLAGILLIPAFNSTAQDNTKANPQSHPATVLPCSNAFKIDPSRLKEAEESGLPMLDPQEIAKAGPLNEHSKANDSSILLISGELKQGKREFAVPVDSTVQFLSFSVFIQCVSSITILDPAGTQVSAGPQTEEGKFHSGRLVNVTDPQAGLWRIRIEGSGVYSISAGGRSSIRFTKAEFVGSSDGALPKAGVTQKWRATLQGDFSTVQFVVMTSDGMTSVFKTEHTENPQEFVGDVSAPSLPFRIIAEGTDTNGQIFRRFFPLLFRSAP